MDINLKVYRDSFFAIIGLNGAGRSILLYVLSGATLLKDVKW
ncbi:ATP-binding cassette domain-containing protein [Bartonella sp. B12(2025)]